MGEIELGRIAPQWLQSLGRLIAAETKIIRTELEQAQSALTAALAERDRERAALHQIERLYASWLEDNGSTLQELGEDMAGLIPELFENGMAEFSYFRSAALAATEERGE